MTKANEQYLVEQAEHYLHGGMHYTTLQKSSENYVDSLDAPQQGEEQFRP